MRVSATALLAVVAAAAASVAVGVSAGLRASSGASDRRCGLSAPPYAVEDVSPARDSRTGGDVPDIGAGSFGVVRLVDVALRKPAARGRRKPREATPLEGSMRAAPAESLRAVAKQVNGATAADARALRRELVAGLLACSGSAPCPAATPVMAMLGEATGTARGVAGVLVL